MRSLNFCSSEEVCIFRAYHKSLSIKFKLLTLRIDNYFIDLKAKTNIIKNYALKVGFDDVGIVKANFLSDEKERFLKWLENDFHADMGYMNRNVDKRLDPRLLVENAKSIIVLLKNYYPEKQQINDTYKISKYSYGADYHYVIKEKLKQIYDFIDENIEPINGRFFVDSAPVLEKIWAKKAGLGWIGKNSLLLTKKGSFFFICEIILDIELEYDNSKKITSYCGNCTKCIDSCPTEAIKAPYLIDSKKCISYQTIENKSNIDENLKNKFENWIFGCDICQDVCPWNKRHKYTSEENFKLSDLIANMTKPDWENLTKEKFNILFKNSPLKRAKYTSLMRNVKFVN